MLQILESLRSQTNGFKFLTNFAMGFSTLVLCHFKYYTMNKCSLIVGLIFQKKKAISKFPHSLKLPHKIDSVAGDGRDHGSSFR